MGLLRALLGSSVFSPSLDLQSELFSVSPLLFFCPFPPSVPLCCACACALCQALRAQGAPGCSCRFSSWLVHGAGAERQLCAFLTSSFGC